MLLPILAIFFTVVILLAFAKFTSPKTIVLNPEAIRVNQEAPKEIKTAGTVHSSI